MTHDILLIVSLMSGVAGWMGLILMLCSFGENVTNAFGDLHPAIFGLPWYLYPVEQQKLVIIMLRASQEPNLISGYFGVTCSHEMYKKVRNSSLFE